MTSLRNLRHISAGISLALLALGFFLLGLLSLINRPQGGLTIASALENNFCVVGSVVSILAGVVFLVATCIYWSR
jgi:hypothetical protein